MHEQLIKKKFVYRGRVIDFRMDTVRLHTGRTAGREFMSHPGAVAVLPVLPGRKIVLVRQFRYPVNRVTYEIPAGKLGRGENPLSCIRRELAEETNLRAKKLKKLISFWPTAAFSNEIIHIYLGEDLVSCPGKPDYDEHIERVEVPQATVLRWIQQGKIKDSKTIIAFLLFAARKQPRCSR